MPYTSVNPYITVAELCEELKVQVPTVASAEEDKFKRAIDHASRWLDEYTNTTYYLRDYSVVPLTLDEHSAGVYGNTIFLPHAPIISIDSVELAGTELVEGTEFSISGDGAARLFRMGANWNISRPDNLLTIYGEFGYPQASPSSVPTGLPGKVTLVTRLVAAVLTGDSRKEFIGVDGSVEGLTQVEIPKTVYQILGRRAPLLC